MSFSVSSLSSLARSHSSSGITVSPAGGRHWIPKEDIPVERLCKFSAARSSMIWRPSHDPSNHPTIEIPQSADHPFLLKYSSMSRAALHNLAHDRSTSTIGGGGYGVHLDICTELPSTPQTPETECLFLQLACSDASECISKASRRFSYSSLKISEAFVGQMQRSESLPSLEGEVAM